MGLADRRRMECAGLHRRGRHPHARAAGSPALGEDHAEDDMARDARHQRGRGARAPPMACLGRVRQGRPDRHLHRVGPPVRGHAAGADCREPAAGALRAFGAARLRGRCGPRPPPGAAVRHRHHRQLRQEQHEVDDGPHPAVQGPDARRERQHQHADGDHAAHPGEPGLRPPVHGRRDGRVRDRIDPSPLRADAAVGGNHHGGRRYAPRAVWFAREHHSGEERARARRSAPAGCSW